MIIHENHHLTKLLVRFEHIHLLHTGRTLMLSLLSRRFHILRMKIAIQSIVHAPYAIATALGLLHRCRGNYRLSMLRQELCSRRSGLTTRVPFR